MKHIFLFFLLIILCGSRAMPAWALLPADVLVIANGRVPESLELARYYMKKRAIPPDNLLILSTTDKESCSRESYNREIAGPVRAFLNRQPPAKHIHAFVTLLGVPLKIEPPELNGPEQKQLSLLQRQRAELLHSLQSAAEPGGNADAALRSQLVLVDKKIKRLSKADYGAAVDSELSLVKKIDYELNAWQPNPLFVGYRNLLLEITQTEVLMGSRIDAPSLAITKRMINDSLAAEQDGLRGTAYFDAKGPPSFQQNLKGYARYDQSLHLAAAHLKQENRMPVVVNDRPEVFQAGEAPNAALYCGWYSLSRYVDAFDWQRGAIGYHIASGECVTLRAGAGQGWCKRLLEDGVAATIGPVAEPYIQAFPEPDRFFKLLTSGEETLVEAFFHSQPFLSWQMILIGDPLYRPIWIKSP